MAPNMGAGSYSQDTSDLEEEEATEAEQQRKEGQYSQAGQRIPTLAREWRIEPSPIMKWADCVEEELEDEKEEKKQVEDECEEREPEQ